MNSDVAGLLWFVVLLLVNGFFVGAEFALISARRAQIEPRAEAGSRPAKITIQAMESVSLLLATAQLGITIASLLILVVVEPSIHHLIEPGLLGIGLSEATAGVTSFILTLILVSFLHVVVGEMVPKNISFSVPERAALVLVPPLYVIAQIVKPVVFVLNAIANGMLKLMRVEPKNEANSAFTLDQVEDIVQHSTREGVLNDASGALSNTFEFTEKQVHHVAVPIANVKSFDDSVTPRQVERAVSSLGFSRYPLTDDDGDFVGYLHLKDVIDLREDELDDAFPTKRVRTLISLPANMELEDALASMRRVHSHMAKSFDRNGKVTGILFLEDILEELVGEVQDATQKAKR